MEGRSLVNDKSEEFAIVPSIRVDSVTGSGRYLLVHDAGDDNIQIKACDGKRNGRDMYVMVDVSELLTAIATARGVAK